MKKQILILTLFTLALIFAGTNKSYGQTYINYVEGAAQCAPALNIACANASVSGHLNPNPGQNYNYAITTVADAVDAVHWFVTAESDVIWVDEGTVTLQTIRDADGGGGTYILDAENGVYDVSDNTTKDIDISWKNFDPADEVLLVAYVTGAADCSDNVEVWRIEPTFAFTLDVLSMAYDGSLGSLVTPASECVSPVESAIYDGTNLGMDYGENWVFFSVNAANFVDSWMPTMDAVSSNGGTVGAVEWAYASEAVLNSGGVSSGDWNASGVKVDNATGVAGTIVGAGGECIVVRVEVQHNELEAPVGAASATVTLTIDGIMYDPVNDTYLDATLGDLDNSLVVGGSCQQGVSLDIGEFTLLPRPDIIESNPAAISFEIKN